MDPTICAVSTASGTGAISIIRCSGPEAISIVASVFRGKNLLKVPSHTITYGHIVDQDEIIDEVLVSVMKAPKTFTMEDVVEINSHGGIAVTNRVLELLLKKGCALAAPGEFTKRAFLNGRIDLLEAESIGDLIVSETEKMRKLAINQLTGALSKKVDQIRAKVIAAQASIEVNIDYPEYEDIEIITSDTLIPLLLDIRNDIENLVTAAKTGEIIHHGIDVAIIGRPNVGKSSILNTLLNEEKAIVTNIPGTTRDIIEGRFILEGIVLNIIDTAGLRETKDVVEKIGVKKSLSISEKADLIIYVLDHSQNDFTEDLAYLKTIKDGLVIIFINKDDLDSKNDYHLFKKYPIVKGNTLAPDGLEMLKAEITQLFNLKAIETKDFTYLSNARQLFLVKTALEYINNALEGLKKAVPIDMITIDLKNCYEYLGEIIGETYKEDLLEELFSKFCLGK